MPCGRVRSKLRIKVYKFYKSVAFLARRAIFCIFAAVHYRTVHLLHSPYENVKLAIARPIAKGDFHGLAAYLFTDSEQIRAFFVKTAFSFSNKFLRLLLLSIEYHYYKIIAIQILKNI